MSWCSYPAFATTRESPVHFDDIPNGRPDIMPVTGRASSRLPFALDDDYSPVELSRVLGRPSDRLPDVFRGPADGWWYCRC